MTEYNFYYDESEHSRRINYDTIMADNFYDTFVAVIVGWRSDDEFNIEQKYLQFEEKYSERKSKGELKSTAIRLKQLKNGFASLSPDTCEFVKDFFDLFNEKIFLYFVTASKIEHIILQLFSGYHNSVYFDMDALKYSITKALVTYRPQEVLECIYKCPDKLVEKLKKFFLVKIEQNKTNLKLKQRENNIFKEIVILLNDVEPIKMIDWNYDIAFYGFRKFLYDKDLTNYSLKIDKQGKKNTLMAAKALALKNVEEQESVDFVGIRMADMLAGLISKLFKSMNNQLCYYSLRGEVKKNILSKEWFEINEAQLKLYKKMYNILIELNKDWYKAFAGIYSDDLVSLIALLEFMNHFETVEEIERDLCMQGEYFNSYACQRLEERFDRMKNKLPIDFIQDKYEEYFFNQKGAKIFFDISKQPELNIKDSCVYTVLSVGLSRENVPLVTIIQNNKAKCYRLPLQLLEWVVTLVGFASMGTNMFPANVQFSKIYGKYYADIL